VPGSSNATSTTGPITWVILPLLAIEYDVLRIYTLETG